ncbi:MAG: hypothetical protein HOM14_02815 [Gammaproteobacteria bacterium]|jgi:hypothetical protein|nr:hypothetical protein [Gammaproteobacteria bacterium]MBT3725454.1 hypothetical protein [Gammaproteobacteria bacterium]MBT4077119.1 hypothetical protein [Gammaproteobacteria bacterium]MBT4195567.1 hypothetical protein [Gammaproteobacteria bacterium]MBT4448222.1 hypothetical protein [Gammaproteobacteria bacterium]
MNKLLSEWQPSESAMDLIRLNGINDEQIEKSLAYLKSQSELVDIDDVDGYDNWNAFFIMFCIKAGNQ